MGTGLTDGEDPEQLWPHYFAAPARILLFMMQLGGVDQAGTDLLRDLYERYWKSDNWFGAFSTWEKDYTLVLALDTSAEALVAAIPFLQNEMSRPRARELLRLLERMAGRNGVIEGQEADFYNSVRAVVEHKIPYFDAEAEKRRISQYKPLQPGMATPRQMMGARPPRIFDEAVVEPTKVTAGSRFRVLSWFGIKGMFRRR